VRHDRREDKFIEKQNNGEKFSSLLIYTQRLTEFLLRLARKEDLHHTFVQKQRATNKYTKMEDVRRKHSVRYSVPAQAHASDIKVKGSR
jgi:hypothetical protein